MQCKYKESIIEKRVSKMSPLTLHIRSSSFMYNIQVFKNNLLLSFSPTYVMTSCHIDRSTKDIQGKFNCSMCITSLVILCPRDPRMEAPTYVQEGKKNGCDLQ